MQYYILATKTSLVVILLSMLLLAIGVKSKLFIYLSLLGGYAGLVWYIPYIINLRAIKTNHSNLLKFFIYISLLLASYFTAWGVVAFLVEQHPKDIIGSTLRVELPLLTALLTFISLNYKVTTPDDLRSRISDLFGVLFTFALLGGILKLFLVVFVGTYGWGLHGYNIPTYILTFFLIKLVVIKDNVNRKKDIFFFLLMLLASILSFKRANWIEILFIFTAFFILIGGKARIKFAFFSLIASVLLYNIMANLGFIDLLTDRFYYTFSNEDEALDSSSLHRVKEVDAVLYTMTHLGPSLSWLVGMGPGAGYSSVDGYIFKNVNELGQGYDIHSGFFLILFRYGIIGVVGYLSLFLPAFYLCFYFRNKLRSKVFNLHDKIIIAIGLSCSLYFFSTLIRMLVSFGLFGNWESGIILALLLSCYGYTLKIKSRGIK